jgi:hypothetical protein
VIRDFLVNQEQMVIQDMEERRGCKEKLEHPALLDCLVFRGQRV